MSSKTNPKRTIVPNKNQQKSKAPLIIWSAIVAGVIGLGYLLFLSIRGPVAIEDVVTLLRQPRGHDDTQTYEESLPPAGGLHKGIWQNCGIYDEPIDGANAVHSLEHGALWIAYQPTLSDADVQALQDIARSNNFLLLSPYPGLSSPIVLTVWEVQLELDSVDDNRIADFIAQYQGGRTTPERGATCSGGVGAPIN